MKKVLVLTAALLLPQAAQAQSYIDVCARALTYTDISSRDDLTARYAYLNIKIEELRKSGNTSASIEVPGYGALGYSEAKAEASRLESQLGVQWNLNQSRGYVARYVSTNSNSTFLNCVREVLGRQPVALELVNSSTAQLTVRVHIAPNPAASGFLTLDLRSNGRFANPVQRQWTIAGGSPTALIQWADPGSDLNVIATVRSPQSEVGSDSLAVPPSIQTRTEVTQRDVTSDRSLARCGGAQGRPEQGYGPTIILTAGPSQRFDLDNIAVIETANFGRGRPELSRPSQADMRFDTKSATRIVARAWCEVWADERFGWEGYLQVPVITTRTAVTRPQSNGLGAQLVQAPAP